MSFADEWDAIPATATKGSAVATKADPFAGRPPAEAAAIRRLMEANAAGKPYSETVPSRPMAIPAANVLNRAPSSSLADEWDSIGAKSATPAKQTKAPARPLGVPGLSDFAPAPKPSPTIRERLYGAGEAGLSMLTGAAAQPVAALGAVATGLSAALSDRTLPNTPTVNKISEDRAREILDSLTYRPRTEAGKDALTTAGDVARNLQGIGPSEMIALSDVAAGLRTGQRINKTMKSAGVGVRAGAGESGEAGISVLPPKAAIGPSGERAGTLTATQTAAPAAFGSVGAAGASDVERARAMAAGAHPDIRAIVERAAKKGGVNLDALQRHVEADSLPVPVELTAGQATGDVSRLSFEQNLRGKEKALADHFGRQNSALVENVDRIREGAAPDIHGTTKPEIGNVVIDAYKAKDAALNADISAKYAALKNANGGQFPIDINAFGSATAEALQKELKTRFVPPELKLTLKDVAKKGYMTFEDFENLRTISANVQRSAKDGNVRAAAGIIRDQLEAMPMPSEAAHLKPLADTARAAARDRFSLLKADPAHKAVVDGRASADSFVADYVFRKDTKTVQTMFSGMDEQAKQAVRAGVVNQLKERAGIVNGAGNFSQRGFNKALEAIRPKLGIIFEPEQRQQLETLGNVSRYTMEQPKGSFVNNSNSTVAAIANAAKEGAKTTLEGVGNYAVKGMPVGTFTRKYLENRSKNKMIDEALKPGAGVLLKDVGK